MLTARSALPVSPLGEPAARGQAVGEHPTSWFRPHSAGPEDPRLLGPVPGLIILTAQFDQHVSEGRLLASLM